MWIQNRKRKGAIQPIREPEEPSQIATRFKGGEVNLRPLAQRTTATDPTRSCLLLPYRRCNGCEGTNCLTQLIRMSVLVDLRDGCAFHGR